MKELPALAFEKKNGQSLVEVVASIGIILLILTGIITATTYSVRNARFAKNQSQATKFANEVKEWLRSQRDELDWNTFYSEKATGGEGFTYCFNQETLSWPEVGPCSGYDLKGMFKRQVVLKQIASDQVLVTINVFWQAESGEHKSTLETYLTQW